MSDSPRYFPNDPHHLRRADARKELIASLRTIIHEAPPARFHGNPYSFAGLYSGPTSTAYLFYQLSKIYPDLDVAGKSLEEWCSAYLEPGDHLRHGEAGKLDPAHCGIAQEELVHLTVSAAAHRNATLVTKLCDYAPMLAEPHNGGSDEWLYGRSGYLYLLRLVQRAFQEHSQVRHQVQAVIDQTCHRILRSPRPWTWHGKAYLGAAHGAIGIVTQVVLSSPRHAQALEHHLEKLLDLQFPSGNFPSSLPPGSDRLVQFCHGAPGFVLSLVSLRGYFPGLTKKIDAAIDRAQRCIWERGLLTKEPCLCHGISSNAIALEDPAQREHFLSYMTRAELEKRWHLSTTGDDDSFHALYTGEAGRAWAWAVLDSGLGCACIGYNDL